jgi:uncharacterized membrane protein YkoI
MFLKRKLVIPVFLLVLLVAGVGGFALFAQNHSPARQDVAVCADDDANEVQDANDDDANEAGCDEADAGAAGNTGITADAARDIAVAETGGTVLDVEYDRENRVEIFEVELEDGSDVKVSASDGTILKIEIRDAD